jgi:hypothetical protein
MTADPTDQVQVNYREAMSNRAKLEFLEHRSALNQRVIEVTLDFANINSQLIDTNRKIMDANAGIIDFNSAQIAANSALLKDGVSAAGATAEVCFYLFSLFFLLFLCFIHVAIYTMISHCGFYIYN